MIAVCIASCVLTELVYEKLMKLPVTVGDLSAVVTGVILAVNMPVGIPLWMPALGGVFAILVVKQLFGGLGHNIMNPALAARCFLLISFAAAMTSFPETCRVLFGTAAQSGSTPLAAVRTGASIDWFDMIFNTHTGCIGEAFCWVPCTCWYAGLSPSVFPAFTSCPRLGSFACSTSSGERQIP